MQNTQQDTYGIPTTGIMRAKELVPLLPFGRVTLFNLSASGAFPKGHKLTDGVTVWRCSEVIAWLDEKTGINNNEQ